VTDITKDFTQLELSCPCCKHAVIDYATLDALQELRDLVDLPIKVNSFYRCHKHNLEVGGHPQSLHRKGKAADISIKGKTPFEMYSLACRIPAFAKGGIGIYSTFIHVDTRKVQSRWGRVNGEYMALTDAIDIIARKGDPK
jgi:uncharacterized protein YcbK (DUF882 family)